MYLKDYNGAIIDFTKAIDLDPNYAAVYYNRGVTKGVLEDYNGAIADYTKAIELDLNYNLLVYVNRGLAKKLLGDMSGACADWKKAVYMGDTMAAKLVAENCN